MLLIYYVFYVCFAVELREQLDEALEQIAELQEQVKKVKHDLAKAKAENGNNKRKRQQEEDEFAQFQLFQEFKRQRQEQAAPVHLHQATIPHPLPPRHRPTWLTNVDASGRPFFINTITGHSQWERPF